jgi:co-chaperonin GroES (HSP10)
MYKALHDLVSIEIVEQDKDRYKVGELFLPDRYIENEKLVRGKITSIGTDAVKSGLQLGDIVYFDKHSIYATEGSKGTDTVGKVVLTKVENVIWKCL